MKKLPKLCLFPVKVPKLKNEHFSKQIIQASFTHNLVGDGLEEGCHDVDEVLALDQLQLHEHAFHTRAPAAPQSIHVLRFLHEHVGAGRFLRLTIVTCIRQY